MNYLLWLPLSLLVAKLLHQLTGTPRKFLYPLVLLAVYLMYGFFSFPGGDGGT